MAGSTGYGGAERPRGGPWGPAVVREHRPPRGRAFALTNEPRREGSTECVATGAGPQPVPLTLRGGRSTGVSDGALAALSIVSRHGFSALALSQVAHAGARLGGPPSPESVVLWPPARGVAATVRKWPLPWGSWLTWDSAAVMAPLPTPLAIRARSRRPGPLMAGPPFQRDPAEPRWGQTPKDTHHVTK